jgi:hypothetical protein
LDPVVAVLTTGWQSKLGWQAATGSTILQKGIPLDGSSSPLQVVGEPPPADTVDSGSMLRRSAVAIAISLAATATLTLTVFIIGTVIGLGAFGHIPEPEPQPGDELSGEGAGLWIVSMLAISGLIVAPIVYLGSVLISTAKLLPPGNRMLPRLLALAAVPMLWLFRIGVDLLLG